MLEQLLSHSLTHHPDRPLIEFEKQWYSATQLETTSSTLASRFRQAGVEPVDRITMLLPNTIEAVETILACFKGGFVVVPLDYRHRALQIDYALNHSGANVLVIDHSRLSEMAELNSFSRLKHVIVVGGDAVPSSHLRYEEFLSSGFTHDYTVDHQTDDLCVMIYTSGTTSRPKGVTLTRGAIEQGILKYLARVSLSDQDATLIAAPITRPMALRCQLLPMLYAGGSISLLPEFSKAAYVDGLTTAPSKTFLSLLPAGLSRLIVDPKFQQSDFSRLRLFICGGDRVPVYLHEQFKQLTGVAITEQCGASEVGAYSQNPPFGQKKPGSIGLPMYGTQVCVVDQSGHDVAVGKTGEIIVKSSMTMEGYWNDTALSRKTIRDGWVYTGDLGQFDEDGYLWFMGRKKDIIIRGGSNVSPHEIESILLSHPAVANACVIGMHDLKWGQVPFAFVVAHQRQENQVTEADLLELCQKSLADYMLPQTIEWIEAMPLKGPGKINRDLLKIRGDIRRFIDRTSFDRHNIDYHFILDITPHLQHREYPQGHWIYRQGEVADSLYFLTMGTVEHLSEKQGKQIEEINEGNYLGEACVMNTCQRANSIKAKTDCEVLQLKHSDSQKLASRYPRFRAHLLKQ